LVSFANIGCQTETCYSCDEEINSWAKENIEFLKSLSRIELVKLSSEKQRAAFRTYLPKKRKELWHNKITQIKSLEFSKKEMKHLAIIEQFINDYNFSKELTYNQVQFLNSWFEKGKQDYNWSDYFLVSGFSNLTDAILTKVEFQKKYLNKIKESSNRVDDGIQPISGNSCDCRWDITCQLSGLGDCSNPHCDDTTLGCGWLIMQSCTGDCSETW
jgi:hypothetical protein